MSRIMNLFGKSTDIVKLSMNTCELIAAILSEGEGVDVNYTRALNTNLESIIFVSQDGKTEWKFEATTGTLTITRSTLRNRGEGTWSKVMSLLKRRADADEFTIVLRDVKDVGTITWCSGNKFTQMPGSDDFAYKTVK